MVFLPLVLMLAFWLAAIFGWVMNLINVVTEWGGPLTGEMLVSVIGIPVAFVGALMGYVSLF